MLRGFDVESMDPIIRGNDVLQKSAPPSPFHIGQVVKADGREGTVVDVTQGGLVEIRFSASLSGLYAKTSVVAA
jgi:hypothetical protein